MLAEISILSCVGKFSGTGEIHKGVVRLVDLGEEIRLDSQYHGSYLMTCSNGLPGALKKQVDRRPGLGCAGQPGTPEMNRFGGGSR